MPRSDRLTVEMRAHTYRLFVHDLGLRGGAAVLFHHGFGFGCGTNKTSTGGPS
jgi:hypothetical protein